MTYVIGEGEHRASPRPFKLHFGGYPAAWRWRARFGPGCIYRMEGADRWDHNKLVGVSIGLHHNTSFRFGWRCVDGTLEVSPYVWREGRRQELDFVLCRPKVGVDFFVGLEVGRRAVTFSSECEGTSTVYSMRVGLGAVRWGYFLNPYFGGNKRAPNSMVINLEPCK